MEAKPMDRREYVVLTIVFYREEGDSRWLAECRKLGTASYGDTLEEARERIIEAVELHLNTLERYGERGRFFRERGIKTKSEAVEANESEINAPLDPAMYSQPYVHSFVGV
jgi:predicted RNase H-like HicB family nuclease